MASTGVGSFGSVNASSGFRTTQVASVGLLDASSGVNVSVVAPAAPVAGTFYRDTAIRAWVVVSANATFALEMGIASVANPATGIYTVTLATIFASSLSWAPFVCGWNTNEEIIVTSDPRSLALGVATILTFAAGASATKFNAGFTFFAVGS